MAIREAEINEIGTRGDDCHVITWEGIANGDTGAPIEMPGSIYRSVQLSGAFGAAARVVIEGSNNGTDWATLRDSYGNNLSFTGAGISNVGQLTRYIRPRGDSGASLSARVDLLMRRSTK